jgi:putative membrane protein
MAIAFALSRDIAMRTSLLVLLSMAAYPALAIADPAPTASDFVTHAEIGGQLEVQAGKIAAEKGQTAEVKKFGQQMVQDHMQLGKKLDAAIAKSNNQALPKKAPLDQEAQTALKQFESASASNFDRVYIDAMVIDHKKDIAEFESYASSGDDPVIRSAAQKALPTLKMHLAMAEKIQKKMK